MTQKLIILAVGHDICPTLLSLRWCAHSPCSHNVTWFKMQTAHCSGVVQGLVGSEQVLFPERPVRFILRYTRQRDLRCALSKNVACLAHGCLTAVLLVLQHASYIGKVYKLHEKRKNKWTLVRCFTHDNYNAEITQAQKQCQTISRRCSPLNETRVPPRGQSDKPSLATFLPPRSPGPLPSLVHCIRSTITSPP